MTYEEIVQLAENSLCYLFVKLERQLLNLFEHVVYFFIIIFRELLCVRISHWNKNVFFKGKILIGSIYFGEYLQIMFSELNLFDRPMGVTVQDIVLGAEGWGSIRAAQIGHSVANGSSPLRCFFEACVGPRHSLNASG